MIKDMKMLQAILDRVALIDRKLEDGFKGVNSRIEKTEEKLEKRMDKLGLQIAELEDDAPTIKEFEELERKVVKIQNTLELN